MGDVKSLSSLLIIFFCYTTCFAQKQYRVSGKVIDDSTHMPISYVSIGIIGSSTSATVSNDQGEFEIKLDTLSQKLVFRHIAYEPKELVVSKDSVLNVQLKLATLQLKTVLVDASLPYKYVKKAFNQAESKIDFEYGGKAFYRQITSNSGKPVEILEAQTLMSDQGIKKRELQQGRYAIKKEGVMRFTNFSYLTAVKSFYPEIKGIIFPTVANPEIYYDMQMEGTLKKEGIELVKISFVPKPGLDKPALEGTIVLNSKNYDIINITGKIVSPPAPLISISSPGYKAKNQVYSFIMNFTEKDSYEIPVLDNIRIGPSFDLYKDQSYLGETEVKGTLLVYDLDNDTAKHLNKMRKKDNDLNIIRKSNYDPIFWESNPVIKRTPLEEELISSFDKNNAFGTLVDQ